jgi:hypothetical protein
VGDPEGAAIGLTDGTGIVGNGVGSRDGEDEDGDLEGSAVTVGIAEGRQVEGEAVVGEVVGEDGAVDAEAGISTTSSLNSRSRLIRVWRK